MKPADTTLTKADTVALWHAVDSYALQVDVMPSMTMPDGSKFTPEQIERERERLLQAKRALRKANAIRKAGATQQSMRQSVLELQQGAGEKENCRPTGNLQADHKAAGGPP